MIVVVQPAAVEVEQPAAVESGARQCCRWWRQSGQMMVMQSGLVMKMTVEVAVDPAALHLAAAAVQVAAAAARRSS